MMDGTNRRKRLTSDTIKKTSRSKITPLQRLKYRLRSRYELTLEEYYKLLEHNNGRCYICNRPQRTRRLHVEHNHRIEKAEGIRKSIRGIVCWGCNAGLYKFKDNPEALRKAAEFLESMPAQQYIKED